MLTEFRRASSQWGDPLTPRTTHEPKGRPSAGNPPFAWEDSAADALAFDNSRDGRTGPFPASSTAWKATMGRVTAFIIPQSNHPISGPARITTSLASM